MECVRDRRGSRSSARSAIAQAAVNDPPARSAGSTGGADGPRRPRPRVHARLDSIIGEIEARHAARIGAPAYARVKDQRDFAAERVAAEAWDLERYRDVHLSIVTLEPDRVLRLAP